MITQEMLLEMSVNAEIEREELIKSTTGDQRSGVDDRIRKLYYRGIEAEAALRWMEEGGIEQIEQLGPFGSKPVTKGQRVKIKRGAVIRTTHPAYNAQNPKIAKRTYTVTVFSVSEGYMQTSWWPHRREEAHREQSITWPGEGGYWCWVDTKDIELIV